MIRVTRRYRFTASHRLHSPSLSEPENERTFGKCNNPYGHGHNYILEVTVKGPVDERSGLAVDVPALDALVQERVLRAYDYRHMNADLPEFQSALVPTTENVAINVRDRLRSQWPENWPALDRVRLYETRNNTFEISS